MIFPDNPELNLGIRSDYKYDNFKEQFLANQIKRSGTRGYEGKLYRYAFSDYYIKTLTTAEKVGLYHWETPKNAPKHREVDVVALKVDGETLLGEIETVYKGNSKFLSHEDNNGSVKFTLYYRGNPDIPIQIMRDDFIRDGSSAHVNKIDENYHLILDRYIPPKTKGSHRHYLNGVHQLSFTKPNQSINVEPLPINKTGKNVKEIRFNNLAEMREQTIKSLNYNDKIMDEKYLLTKSIKKIVDHYPMKMSYSKYGKKISPAEVEECKRKYNSSIEQVIQNERMKFYVRGSVDELAIERCEARKLYYKTMGRDIGIKSSKYPSLRPAYSVVNKTDDISEPDDNIEM